MKNKIDWSLVAFVTVFFMVSTLLCVLIIGSVRNDKLEEALGQLVGMETNEVYSADEKGRDLYKILIEIFASDLRIDQKALDLKISKQYLDRQDYLYLYYKLLDEKRK
jgi:hypothetical protein